MRAVELMHHVRSRFGRSDISWSLSNYVDRPWWAVPYFAFQGAMAFHARRSDYRRWISSARVPPADAPEVSVIMTMYRTGAHATEAVRSVLAQTWRKIDLIVVDDASPEGIPQELSSISKADGRLRVYRLSVNSGTYFAKNVGRLLSRAPLIATHDSDDKSDPDWLATHVSAHATFPWIVASQNHYLRVTADGGVVKNRGALSRPALMSMVYNHRALARSVGFFDSVRWAADREYSDRIIAALGKDKILRFDDRHYYALVRDGQLTAQSEVSLSAKGARDTDYMSPDRLAYITAADAWRAGRHPCDLHMPFPLRKRAFPAPQQMSPHSPGFDPSSVRVSGAGIDATVGELAVAYREEFLDA